MLEEQASARGYVLGHTEWGPVHMTWHDRAGKGLLLWDNS